VSRDWAVVGVHGIWNLQVGKDPAEAAAVLGQRWSTALRRGLGSDSEVQAAVAYYAHHLAGDAAQGADDPAQLSEPEQEMLLRWAAALGAPDEVAQGRLTQPARAAADWIARRFGLDKRVVRLLVTSFCREVPFTLETTAPRLHGIGRCGESASRDNATGNPGKELSSSRSFLHPSAPATPIVFKGGIGRRNAAHLRNAGVHTPHRTGQSRNASVLLPSGRRDRELWRMGWEVVRIRESEYEFDPERELAPLWSRLGERGISPRDDEPSDGGRTDWAPVELQDELTEDEQEALG
jgi:hypothetical protein